MLPEHDGSDGDISLSSCETLQTDLSTLTCVHGACNNFLLQQDPLTGHLTLLPVHIAVPITGQKSLSDDNMRNKSDIKREGSVSPERTKGQIQSVTSERCSCLQHIIDLLRHQLIFEGHLESGSKGNVFNPHFSLNLV